MQKLALKLFGFTVTVRNAHTGKVVKQHTAYRYADALEWVDAYAGMRDSFTLTIS